MRVSEPFSRQCNLRSDWRKSRSEKAIAAKEAADGRE
jgi:hypothetical protein